MVKAYVLINCEVDSILSATDSLAEIPEVVAAGPVTGRYDIIAEVEVDRTEDLREVVPSDIHQIKGIKNTKTCIST